MEKKTEIPQNKVSEKIKENKREENTTECNQQKRGSVGKCKDLNWKYIQKESKKSIAAKKPWASDEMIRKMNERRKWENIAVEEGKRKFKQLNNELRRETDKTKEEWWKEKCKDWKNYIERVVV